jgi:hypothetical protein
MIDIFVCAWFRGMGDFGTAVTSTRPDELSIVVVDVWSGIEIAVGT